MWGWRWGTDPKGFASLSDTAPPANTAPPTLGRDLGPLAVLLMKGCTAATASEAHNRAMGVTDTLLALPSLIPAGKSAAWPERNHTEHPEPPRALGGPVLIPTTPIPIAVRAGARWGHWDGGWGTLQGAAPRGQAPGTPPSGQPGATQPPGGHQQELEQEQEEGGCNLLVGRPPSARVWGQPGEGMGEVGSCRSALGL